MRIVAQHFLRGPNLYSRGSCFLVELDLEDLDGVSSKQIAGFSERLCEIIPTLHEHRCPTGHAGGFVERLRAGTSMAHIVERVAIELQCLAGTRVGFGRTRLACGKPRHYRVVCAYQLTHVVEYAMEIAIGLLTALGHGQSYDLKTRLESLCAVANKHTIGASTRAVVEAAATRGIPVLRITEDADLFQLGWGSRRKLLRATITGEAAHIAVKIASDKHLTRILLDEASLPVPQAEIVISVDEALRAAREMCGSVTIKPLDADQGEGVTVGICGEEAIGRAFEQARRFSRKVIVEAFIEGHDFRVLVIGGRIAAAARLHPPRLIGAGTRTIRQRVELENPDPACGDGDANLSTGSAAEDVTDLVHPDTRDICIRAARKIGLDIAGIDLVCADISQPLKAQRGAIIEVNAAPGIRMHEFPAQGKPRDIRGAIVESMFDPGDTGRIPVIAVTGTNGKTTTTLLISHGLRLAGLNTGTTTTEGIFINGRAVDIGDCTGYWSARTLLTSAEVDAAVLETARGGILKRGLAFDHCDVGVLLNVTNDHLGLDGVETLADMTRVKAIVVRCATRAAVLNAEDPRCVAVAGSLISGCQVFYFSMDPDNAVLQRHLEEGGRAVYLQDALLVLAEGKGRRPLLEVNSMPIAMRGHARHNIANALAAAAALSAAGHGPELIVSALASFTSDAKHNPLRCNVFDVQGVTVIVDYAHNTVACKALTAMARSMLDSPGARLLAVATAPGDRRPGDLFEVGQVYGAGVDELIVYESNQRGRGEGETSRLILDGARSAAAGRLVCSEADVRDAVALGLSHCRKGDVLVFTCADTLEHLVEAVRRTDPKAAEKIAQEIA